MGAVYTNSKLVPRADMLQTGHPFLLFPLPLILICGISQRVAERNAREQKYADSVLQPDVRCAYRCGDAMPDGTGLAQPVGDFRIWSEVRDSQPPFRVI